MNNITEAQPKTDYISINVNKLAKEIAEKVLDEITYEGKTIKEWAEILIKQQPNEDVLEKIKAEIEEYKSKQLTLAIGIDDLEKGKRIALEYVLAIIDKYKAKNNKEVNADGDSD